MKEFYVTMIRLIVVSFLMLLVFVYFTTYTTSHVDPITKQWQEIVETAGGGTSEP
ncbi:hypothetical protein [Bacillus sp. CGMCC 1.16541]|uniref:hypothetical protein n=1 Tax=Bacillus sp. CGMCC 1.16541 TaxID=2185143 RepID=UPI00194E1D70|nr:hypothetical protein [Bacillus sp. CGMCC 1.16541]